MGSPARLTLRRPLPSPAGRASVDLTMIVVVGATLAAAAGVAEYLPTRRAAGVDPMAALREN